MFQALLHYNWEALDPRWLVVVGGVLAAIGAQLVWQWGEGVVEDRRSDAEMVLASILAMLFVGSGSYLSGSLLVADVPSALVWIVSAGFYLSLGVVALQDARTMHVHDLALAALMLWALGRGWLEANGQWSVVMGYTWQGMLVALVFYLFTVVCTYALGKEARASGDPLFLAAVAPCLGGWGVGMSLMLGSMLSLVGYMTFHRWREGYDGRAPFLPYLVLAVGGVIMLQSIMGMSLGLGLTG